jgi:hypothetical protein
MQKWFKHSVAMMLAMTFLSCGYSAELDNATSESADIRIDDESYVLKPNETQSIRLKEGSHKVWMPLNTSKSGDTTFTIEVKSDLMIQVPGGRYGVWSDVYGDQSSRDSVLNSSWQVLDSTRYYVDIVLLDTLQWVHPRSWDYGLLEDFPEKIVLGQGDKVEVKRKLLRINDFQSAYKKQTRK